jgi:hypothetical protein
MRCRSLLHDPVSVAEHLCPDCSYDLDLLPEADRIAEVKRLTAARSTP